MNQAILTSCTPWVICLVVAVVAARVLVAISGAKLDFSRLSKVHTNESGSVQSLSFVLTLPFFVMVLMLIVQVNQIMFGNILVHYSAFAAVRSASVWIPANRDPVFETANRISSMTLINSTDEGQQYLVSPLTDGKYSEIQQAATLACMPLAPSRNLGYTLGSIWNPFTRSRWKKLILASTLRRRRILKFRIDLETNLLIPTQILMCS